MVPKVHVNGSSSGNEEGDGTEEKVIVLLTTKNTHTNTDSNAYKDTHRKTE